MRYLLKQIGLFLLIAALLATPCLAESMHRQIDNPSLSLDVTVGYDGLMTYGKTMPVCVRIENSGADLSGTIAINAYNSIVDYNRYEVSLTLAQGAAKEIVIPILVSSQQKTFTVEVLRDDEVICAVNAVPEQLVNPSAMLIGVLSPDPKSLSYMDISMETDDLLRSEYSQIGPLWQACFPADASLLNSFGMLVVDGYDASVFSDEQMEALQTWVSSGHILIVGGGAQAGVTYPAFSEWTGILPGQVSQSPDITPALLTWLGVNDAVLGEDLLLNTASGGNALISDGETPLIWKTTLGSGVIYTTAFELGAKPISIWPMMHTFWQRLLLKDCYELYQNGYSGRSYTYSSMPYMSTQIPMENDFGVGRTLAIAAGFLVVMSIAVYIILRKKDRRQYLWFALPVISILCAAIICFVAAGSDSNRPTALSISTLKQDVDGTQDFESFTSVAIPSRGKHLITVKEGTLRPEAGDYYGYYYDDVEHLPADPTQLNYRYLSGEHNGVGLDFTSPWRAQTFTVEDTAFSAGKLDAVLWREEDGLHGYIVNNTGLDLSEGAVLCQMGYCSVPALRDGERFDLALRSAVFADPKKPVFEDGCIYESLASGYFDAYSMARTYFLKTSSYDEDINVDAETDIRMRIMPELITSDYRDSSYPTTHFYYVAFTDDLPVPSLSLDGAPIARSFSRGAVQADMQLLSVGNTGIVYHTPGIDPAVRCQVGDDYKPYLNEARVSAANEYHRLSESPAFMFDLSDAKAATLTRLIIYNEIQNRYVNLFLYDGESWVQQPLGEEIQNPEDYIDENGRLYVQLCPASGSDEYIEINTPTLLLEGRVQ